MELLQKKYNTENEKYTVELKVYEVVNENGHGVIGTIYN